MGDASRLRAHTTVVHDDPQVPGRLVVRRIPDANAERHNIAADQTHRHHAIIEQVHADLNGSALTHLPSGKFTANAAWLVLAVIASPV